ncbi:MAG TPA: Flp pilus assembly protein CpaB [Candidatus Limnocylindrales bacterium]
MKRANRLMLIVGVALAALSFVAVLALSGMGQQSPQTTPPPDVTVVVAAADLPLGVQITADKLSTTTMPQTAAVGTFQDPAQLVGRVVRQAVSQGTALTNTDFDTGISVPNLINALQPGLRAIAIPLTRVNSVNAFLQAGDYVDVLISMEDADGLNPVVVANPTPAAGTTTGSDFNPYTSLDNFVNNTSVKVVVQNVQVLAAIAAQPVNTTDQSNQVPATPQPDMVVLLAVTPQQAEVVRFAQLDGNISLVLRAPADANAPAVDTTGITLKQLVDQYGVLPPAPVTPINP